MGKFNYNDLAPEDFIRMAEESEDNYPPGFTQGDHDRQYGRKDSCVSCGRELDEAYHYQNSDNNTLCLDCAEEEAYRRFEE